MNKNDDHYLIKSNKGKIYSKDINIKYDIKNIDIDIFDEINVTFEIDNNDYHNLISYNKNPKDTSYILEKINEPIRFKNIILECEFKDYSVTLINFIGHETFYKTIQTPQISGKCSYCKFNKNSFKSDDKIKVWDIYEKIRHIDNYFCSEMNNPYLKDKILISNPRNCSKIDKDLDEKLNQMFDELTPYNWLIYQETTYESYLNDHAKFSENLHMLLSYYTSNIEHERISILESIDCDKIEITFTSKNTHKLKGYNFFHWNPDNFVKFLDSSYENYINLKESDFNIDLLIQYYIWFKNEVYLDVRHLLGSIFLEVLIKQYYGNNDNKGFAKKLKNILENKLNLDINKIFEYFERDLNNILENIKLTKMKQLNGYDKNIKSVLNKFKGNLLVEIFTKYRNKNVHSGEIRLNSNDMNCIFDNSYNKTKNALNGDKNERIVEILLKNKDKIISSEKINDLDLQNTVLEDLMEIILLKYFNADCGLLLQDPERKSINSKEYVKLFTK